jgi:ssDNA-binding Zn-finger/Zn-ribbon topoisomerase 1
MEKQLKCKDCDGDFVFTEGEQKFYNEKGFPDPIRCPDCRKAKKNARKNGKNDHE